MVETITDARRHLTKHVGRFRKDGLGAEPVVFGDHRKPEAVVVPFELYELLMDVAEDVAIAERIQKRDASDTGERRSLADVAGKLGIDLDEL